MQEIKAYVRPERVEAVVTAFQEAGVPHLTLTHVRSFGGSRDAEDRRISLEAGDWYTDMAKLECVCTEASVNRLVRVVEVAARHGRAGRRNHLRNAGRGGREDPDRCRGARSLGVILDPSRVSVRRQDRMPPRSEAYMDANAWLWVAIVALLVLCCVGMVFMGRRNR